MTEESYWLNVKRGVTGEDTGTCVLAAFDRISLRCCVSAQTYEAYDWLGEYYEDVVGDAGKFIPPKILTLIRELRRQYYYELGVPHPGLVRKARARSADELEVILKHLTQGGFRPSVSVWMGSLHSVGVIRLGPRLYEARSTGTDFRDDKHVSVEEIFHYVEKPLRTRKRPRSSRKTVPEPNVIALPPEPGSRRYRS